MEYLNAVLGIVAILLIVIYYSDLKKELETMSEKQDEFDAKITAANTALDAIGEAVAAEAKQVADFIATNPQIDTSALDGVVTRLEAVDDSINTVFEPAPTEPPA